MKIKNQTKFILQSKADNASVAQKIRKVRKN